MKKFLWFVAWIATVSAHAEAVSPSNLIQNASFELQDGHVPAQWKYYGKRTPTTWIQARTEDQAGRNGVEIHDDDSSLTVGLQQAIQAVCPEHKYSVEISYRSLPESEDLGAFCQLRFLPSGNKHHLRLDLSDSENSKSLRVQGIAPEGTTSATVYIYSSTLGLTHFLVDQIAMYDLGSARPSARNNAKEYPAYPRCPENIPAEWLAKENHPRMFCTPLELAAAREQGLRSSQVKKYIENLQKVCERFVGMSDAELHALVPPKYCTIVYGLGFNTDPVNGDRLKWCGWEEPFKVKSSRGIIYPNADWPEDGRGMVDESTGKKYYFTSRAYGFVFVELEQTVIPALADVWALTGDLRYAHACAVLLDAVAAVYPTNLKGPIDYPASYGRLDRGTYMVARGLYNYCTAIDLIASSGELNAVSVCSDQKTIRENLVRNMLWDGGTYCLSWADKGTQLTNGQADFLRGAGMAGIMLNQPHFCKPMLSGPKSLDSMLANNFTRDGFYYETSPSYAKHAIKLYFTIAELIEAAVIAGWPDLQSAYENPTLAEALGASFNRREIGGHIPSLGDGGPDMYYNPALLRKPGKKYAHSDRFLKNQIKNAWILLVRGDEASKARSAQLLASTYEGENLDIPADRWSIFHIGNTELERVCSSPASQAVFETGSALYGAKGIAILRGGTGEGRYGSQLFFGPVNAHGQWENMTWMFVDGGAELSYDPGYFNRAYRFGWTAQGVSHQSVIVNKKSISCETGNGFVRAWKQDSPLQWVLASHPAAYAEEGVTQFERLIAQVDALDGNGSGYWLDVSRVAGGMTRDDSFHTVMTELSLDCDLPAPYAPTLFGTLFADSKFLKDYTLTGFEGKSFYWIPPGYGYGFLKDPRAVDMDRAIRLKYSKPGFSKMEEVNVEVIADLLPSENRKLIIAQSHAVGIAPSVPYAIRRDEGAGGSLFAKLIRTVSPEHEDHIKSIEAVPVSGQTDSMIGAWKVVWSNGTTDVCDVWYLGNGITAVIEPPGLERITTDALVAVVRFEKGEASYASCSGGKTLSVGSAPLISRSVAYIRGTVKKAESVSGKLHITADWENGVVEELVRIKNGALLTSSPRVGAISTWAVEHFSNGMLVMQDQSAIIASGVLSPVEGDPGMFRMSPPVSRFFGRIPKERQGTFSRGKAVYAEGVFIGRIDDLQSGADVFRIIKDEQPVLLNKVLPIEIRELSDGDRIEIPVEATWRKVDPVS